MKKMVLRKNIEQIGNNTGKHAKMITGKKLTSPSNLKGVSGLGVSGFLFEEISSLS
jgi:hypothetical protein